jgi:two-component system, sensor histidine kinase and response regulator
MIRTDSSRPLSEQAAALFRTHREDIFAQTDRLFAGLLAFQWMAAIAVALWISPLTWSGATSWTHPHVWAALLLGGLFVSLPIMLALQHPGHAATRHVIAVSQMLMGALLIHLTGGRIETHFHVFGSLAFLAFYRDWRVLVTATLVAGIDHLARGLFWPQSIFGTLAVSVYRSWEHVGWVVFEDVFLIWACQKAVREMSAMAERQAEVEAINASIERTVAERTAQLQSSEARKAAILESAMDSIVSLDHQGRVIEFNPAATALFGYSREAALGRELADLIIPDGSRDRQCSGLACFHAIGDQSAFGKVIELIARRADGRESPVEFTVSAIRHDESLSYTVILRDITARRQTQQAAQQQAIALHKAKDAAEAANRTKSEFLANMSHEIRTPMNGILGMTELALDTELSTEQREYLGAVKLSANALLSVINDILDFSKIEAGKLDLERVDFDLRETIGNMVKPLALRAHEKGLELTFEIPQAVSCDLIGDPTRLRQVLVNLVGNALKFTEKGEVVVGVTVVESSATDVELHFTVRDTGIGIPADKLGLIFEPFSQADGSTTRRFGGTGLGLTISTRLAEMMGGRIWVESEAGSGSTFHFTMRFGVKPASVENLASRMPQKLKGVSALIVDDNPTNLRILKDTLLHWGMEPTAVDGAQAALGVLRHAAESGEPFRLILLDVKMPEMDGFTLAEQIKLRPEYADVTIMMLTSDNQRGDIARCRELGLAGYLVKPIQQAELRRTMIDALGFSVETSGPSTAASSVVVSRESKERRILLAEDNAVNQKVAIRMLSKLGHTVVIANNGKEALAALETQSFDLVFMDVQMPEMGGFEATDLIRRSEKVSGHHLPIIAMTAHAMKGDRERCLEAGMDGYVSKPVQARDLQAAMDAIDIAERSDSRDVEDDTDNVEIFDESALLERIDGDRAFLKDLVELFAADSPGQLAAIEDAIARKDADQVHRASHTLKGSVSNFCAPSVVASASRLESRGRMVDLDGAEKEFSDLERLVRKLRSALVALAP